MKGTVDSRNIEVEVRVQPRSSRDRIGEFHDGTLRVYVGAPPERGKAKPALRTRPPAAGPALRRAPIGRPLIVFCGRAASRTRPVDLKRTERFPAHGQPADRHPRRRRHRWHLHRRCRAHARRAARHAQASFHAGQLRGRGDRRSAQPARRARLSARRARRAAARLHGSDQRDPGRKGRPHRTAHHPGVPRRTGTAAGTGAESLRAALRAPAARSCRASFGSRSTSGPGRTARCSVPSTRRLCARRQSAFGLPESRRSQSAICTPMPTPPTSSAPARFSARCYPAHSSPSRLTSCPRSSSTSAHPPPSSTPTSARR